MPSGSALSVGRRGDLYRCLSSSLSNIPLLKICCPPVGVFRKSVSCEAPDVDTITQLGSRMDDTVTESKSAAPPEVPAPLLNLSSGDHRFEQVRHVAPESPLLSLQ